MRKVIGAVIVAIFILCVTATAQDKSQKVSPPKSPSKPPVAASAAAAAPAVEEYRIGVQDLLDVSVWGEPQFDLKVAVRPDGKIGVKLLSDVQAAGLTTKEVETRIAEGLKDIVQKARVTVIVLEIRSQMVTIIGNGVAHMGSYPIGGPTRVLDLLARAGLNDFAKKNEISIVRDHGNKTFTKYPFDYDAYVKGNYSQNILLRNGDTVNVP